MKAWAACVPSVADQRVPGSVSVISIRAGYVGRSLR